MFLAALLLAFNLYYPAISGPFVFDDFTLPYQRTVSEGPLSAWLSAAGVRPFLMFTYWLNYKLSAGQPAGYHALNLLIHVINTVLVFLVLHKLLEMAGWADRRKLAGAAAGTAAFLVHPLQTEAVSYIAGRSESLAALFALLAYLVFVYRREEGISWRDSVLVMVFLAIALGTKENAVGMAGLIVLTDIYWPRPFSTRSMRKNWKLYALMLPGSVVAMAVVLKVLLGSASAGFSLPVKWYQYAFTQCRALFTYLRLALFPMGQSIDHDYPVSHNLWEHSAVIYLLLLGALCTLGVVLRRRYPLACFGLLMTLILLAPTSSIVPINDPLVERRMYLPLLGLILIVSEFAGRLRVKPLAGYGAITAVLVVYALLCYQRNQLWGQPSQLWETAATQSTTNVRPYINLVEELIQEHRCDRALPYLTRADQIFPNNPSVQMSWGRALECVGRRDEALAHLFRAAALQPGSYVYQLIGLLYGEMGKSAEAGLALQKAVDSDPRSVAAHDAFGMWYETVANPQAADREYQISLELDPNDPAARIGMARVRQASAEQ